MRDGKNAPVTYDKGKVAKKRIEKEDVWRKRLRKEKTPQGRLFAFLCSKGRTARAAYSHSIVAGGLPETSYTTREIPLISLMMRFDT